MSSDDDNNPLALPEKRRRVERACDICRKRKIRCEGISQEGEKCSHCTHSNLECTFDMPKRRRGPTRGYVRQLEARLRKMEAMLKLSSLDSSFGENSDEILSRHESPSNGPMNNFVASEANTPPSLGFPISPASDPSSPHEDYYDSSEEEDAGDFEHRGTASWMQNLTLTGAPTGYQGKSSRAYFAKSAFKFRNQFLSEHTTAGNAQLYSFQRRSEMWDVLPWDTTSPHKDHEPTPMLLFDFPERDLLEHLIGNFFRQTNPYFPIFNEILFRRYVSEGLHLNDRGFGATVLLVAALGSRDSNDPRVYVDPGDTQSGGWKWFNQVQQLRKSIYAPATLFDLQAMLLTALFLHGSSTPTAGWSIIGATIRLAADVGAHRRRTYGSKPTVLSEQWKRAFWLLVIMDRQISLNLGRACAIHDEDIDLDLPIECDDEYWFTSDPEQAFKQPQDKPCSISFLIQIIKYFRIGSFISRTIYATNKARMPIGFIGPDWLERVVTYSDSSINEWREAIPSHLRWDPKREDDLFYRQSALLQVMGYLLEITVHRPLVPLLNKRSSTTIPSLEICTNAARGISKVFSAWSERSKETIPWQINPAFISAITLLIHIWSKKKSGSSFNLEEEMEDVWACMAVLKRCEKAWNVAGRQWDSLCNLTVQYQLPLPEGQATLREKRRREHQRGTSSSQRFTSANRPEEANFIPTSVPPLTSPQQAGAVADPLVATYSERVAAPTAVSNMALDPQSALWGELFNAWNGQASASASTVQPQSFSPVAAAAAASDYPSAAAQWTGYAAPPPPLMTEDTMYGAPNFEVPPAVGSAQLLYQDPSGGASNAAALDPSMCDATWLWSQAPESFGLGDWNSYIDGIMATVPDWQSTNSTGGR